MIFSGSGTGGRSRTRGAREARVGRGRPARRARRGRRRRAPPAARAPSSAGRVERRERDDPLADQDARLGAAPVVERHQAHRQPSVGMSTGGCAGANSPAIARAWMSSKRRRRPLRPRPAPGRRRRRSGWRGTPGLVRIHSLGLRPVAEVVDLELDVVAVGVLVVVGERHPVVEAEGRLDPGLAQPQVARVQVLEAVVLERAVVQARARLLVRVVDEAREGEQRDAVVRLVVGEPGADVVLEAGPRRRRASSTSRSSPAGGWS